MLFKRKNRGISLFFWLRSYCVRRSTPDATA